MCIFPSLKWRQLPLESNFKPSTKNQPAVGLKVGAHYKHNIPCVICTYILDLLQKPFLLTHTHPRGCSDQGRGLGGCVHCREHTSVFPAVGCSMRLSSAITLFWSAALPKQGQQHINSLNSEPRTPRESLAGQTPKAEQEAWKECFLWPTSRGRDLARTPQEPQRNISYSHLYLRTTRAGVFNVPMYSSTSVNYIICNRQSFMLPGFKQTYCVLQAQGDVNNLFQMLFTFSLSYVERISGTLFQWTLEAPSTPSTSWCRATQGKLSGGGEGDIIPGYLLTSYCWQRQTPWTCYSWAGSCAPTLHPPHSGCLLPHRGGGNRTWPPGRLRCQGSTETCTGPLPVWCAPAGIWVGRCRTLPRSPGGQGWEALCLRRRSFYL